MSTTNSKEKFSKILVAIDGSNQSMDAASYAIYLSHKYNAELYALHVIGYDVDLFGPHETSEYMIRMRNEGEKYLDKVRLKTDEKNIQIKAEIISSINTAQGIVDYTQEKNLELIVIGTRGRSGFKKLLLGSVASKVVTYAHCPVLVVK
jgi:nucleotide-binding universal stress UspA family protein